MIKAHRQPQNPTRGTQKPRSERPTGKHRGNRVETVSLCFYKDMDNSNYGQENSKKKKKGDEKTLTSGKIQTNKNKHEKIKTF